MIFRTAVYLDTKHRAFSSRRPADKEIETDARRTHQRQRDISRIGEIAPVGFAFAPDARNFL
jgi:hypothetical protein